MTEFKVKARIIVTGFCADRRTTNIFAPNIERRTHAYVANFARSIKVSRAKRLDVKRHQPPDELSNLPRSSSHLTGRYRSAY